MLRNAGYTNYGASEPLDDAELRSNSSGDGDRDRDPDETECLFADPGLLPRSLSTGNLEDEALFSACVGPHSEGDARSDSDSDSLHSAHSKGDVPVGELMPRLTV